MRGPRVQAAAIVATLLSGTGAAVVSNFGSSDHRTAQTQHVGGTGPATSKSAAKHDAEQHASALLKRALLPPGATRIHSRPAGLDAPATGIPSGSSVIDRSALWRVPLGFDATVRWLRSHAPTGLSANGGEDGVSDGGVRTTGFTYEDKPSPSEGEAELAIGAASVDEHETAIRTDAIVVWLDPKPIKDSEQGQRVHVTIGDGCPSTLDHIVGVTNADPDGALSKRLVPDQAPTTGLVCAYNGLNERPAFGLASQRRLDASASEHYAREFYNLNPAHADGAETSCPMDDARYTVYVFAYPGRPDVDVWSFETGCRGAANGHILVGGFVDDA